MLQQPPWRTAPDSLLQHDSSVTKGDCHTAVTGGHGSVTASCWGEREAVVTVDCHAATMGKVMMTVQHICSWSHGDRIFDRTCVRFHLSAGLDYILKAGAFLFL